MEQVRGTVISEHW